MPTPFDRIKEHHDGPEPRVLAKDVQSILEEAIRPDDPDSGLPVALVARRAKVSTRTVYRGLNPPEKTQDVSLKLADQLCLAVGSHVRHCHLVWPDGRITEYR